MAYEVRLQPLAENDLDEAYLWAAKRAPDTAVIWLARFHAVLKTLAENPERCGFAPENKKLDKGLRQLLFGRKPNVFRAVFLVDHSAVRIIRIRRAARRSLKPGDLGE
jgi:plasmid stabilization system protein ParE